MLSPADWPVPFDSDVVVTDLSELSDLPDAAWRLQC